jgi:hypothetical protein
MSEVTWTTMFIGGPVPANKIEEFITIVDNYFVPQDANDDGEWFHGVLKSRLRLELADSQNFGNVDELETFCALYGLSYWKHWEAVSGQFEAGIAVKRPNEPLIECTATSDNGQPALALFELEHRMHQGWSLGDVVTDLRRFDPHLVPPLTIGADVTDEDLDAMAVGLPVGETLAAKYATTDRKNPLARSQGV